jgi:hypothetical protein
MALDNLYKENQNRIRKEFYLLPISPKTTYDSELNSSDVKASKARLGALPETIVRKNYPFNFFLRFMFVR